MDSHCAGKAAEAAEASAMRESGVHEPVAREERTCGGSSLA